MANYKVLYLNHATPDVYDLIRSQLPEGFELVTLERDSDEERRQKLADVDFILTATAKLTKDMIDSAPKLKLIQHQGVGYDSTDVKAAKERGIPVGLTPEGTTIGVAEHTILLILAVYKRLVTAHTSLGQGEWLQFALRPVSFELCGKTLGLIGFGRIGREVAKRARAFEANVIYYDKYAQVAPEEKAALGAREVSFAELLKEADIVSLHLPATAETKHLINAAALQAMKKSAILINTARGSLVDEATLCQALRSGQIAGAGLDVFEKEPPSADNPLFHMDNVIVTPHIAAGTKDALLTKMRAAFANMVRVTKGETPVNLVP